MDFSIVRPVAFLLLSCIWVQPATAQREASLLSSFEAALVHDPELRAARSHFKADREEVQLTWGRLLPNASFSAGYSYENSENIFTDRPEQFVDDPRTTGELEDLYWQVDLTQPLFNWASYQEWRAAQEITEGARYRLSRTEQELILRLSEVYLNLFYAAQQVHINDQRLSTLNLQYEQVQRELELGVGDRINLFEVRARRDLAKTDLLEARSDYQDYQTRLANMTGELFEVPADWVEVGHLVMPQLREGSESEWVAWTRENLNYKESQAQLRGAERTRLARRAGHYPTVNLNLNYLDQDSDDQYRTRQTFRVSIDFSLSLYQGGQTQAALRQATALMEAQAAESDRVLAEAEQEVRLAFLQLKSLEERLHALQRSRESSQLYVQAIERGLLLDLRSQVEVLDARSQLLEVHLRYAEALNQYLLADLRLHLASGRLYPDRLERYDNLFNKTRQAHPEL